MTCNLVGWLSVHSGAGTLAQWVSAVCAACALSLAGFSAFWAAREWKKKHVVEDWAKTLNFLIENAAYQDQAKNLNYQTSYAGIDLVKYELVARRSISYVDDVFHLKLHDQLKDWLKGSVTVFVKPHRQWFDDHSSDYSSAFFSYVKSELK